MSIAQPPFADATFTRSARAKNFALWALQILLALAFFMAGGSKLSGAKMMVDQFDTIGLGQWFRYLTGGLEVIAAILLLVPRQAGVGAILLIPVMLGATAVHLMVLKNSPAAPLVFLALLAVVAWGRLVKPTAAVLSAS